MTPSGEPHSATKPRPRIPPYLYSAFGHGVIQVAANALSAVGYVSWIAIATRQAGTDEAAVFGVTTGVVAIYTALAGGGGRLLTFRNASTSAERGLSALRVTTRHRAALAPLLIVISAAALHLVSELTTRGFLLALSGAANFVGEPATGYLAGRRRYGYLGLLTVLQRSLPVVLLGLVPASYAFAVPYLFASAATTVAATTAARRDRRLSRVSQADPASEASTISFHAHGSQRGTLTLVNVGDAVQNRAIPIMLSALGASPAAGASVPVLAVFSAFTSAAHLGLQPLVPALSNRRLRSFPTRAVAIAAGGATLLGAALWAVLEVARDLGWIVPTTLTSVGLASAGFAAALSALGTLGQVRLTIVENYSRMAVASLSGAAVLLAFVGIAYLTHGLTGVFVTLACSEAVRACTSLFSASIRRRRCD